MLRTRSALMNKICVYLFSSVLFAGFAQNQSLQSNLELAVHNGDAAKIKELVKAGANPNGLNWGGHLLGSAATAGNLKGVRGLVDAGADVNLVSRGGWTALMGAADEGQLEVVKYLVSKKANVNAKTRQGRTAVIRAAFHNQAQVIEYLISQGAKVNEADANGVTALMLAAQRSHEKTVRVLLDKGADKNLKSAKNKTAAMYLSETIALYETGIKDSQANIKKNPQYEKYEKESIERTQKQLSDAKRVLALLTGAEKKSLGRLVGKVFSADGKKLVITGKGIADLGVGQKLKIKTSAGEIAATVKEVLHSKVKATAAKAGAEKGDAVHLDK